MKYLVPVNITVDLSKELRKQIALDLISEVWKAPASSFKRGSDLSYIEEVSMGQHSSTKIVRVRKFNNLDLAFLKVIEKLKDF